MPSIGDMPAFPRPNSVLYNAATKEFDSQPGHPGMPVRLWLAALIFRDSCAEWGSEEAAHRADEAVNAANAFIAVVDARAEGLRHA